MKVLDLVQGSAAWLAFRNDKIGASDAPIIMKTSPWTTPYQLWQIKMGLLKIEENEAMRRGRDMEEMARQKFIELTGQKVFPAVGLHDTIDYMTASFDGISKCGKIILEIKCPGKDDHEMAMDGVIPAKYIPQIQHQLEVNGDAETAFYFSYKNDQSFKILQIERNLDLINEIKEKEKSFWECIQNLEPPELIDRDYIKREDKEWNHLAKEWIEICKIEDRKEEIRKKLISMSGQSNSMGAGIKLSKINRKGNIDYNMIPELKKLDLEKYRKGSIETFRIGIY